MTRPGLVRVAVDLLGGDDAPGAVAEGVRRALDADPDLHVLVAGSPGSPLASGPRLTVLPAGSVVGMGEAPVRAVRTRRDASVRVALEAIRDGAADAAVTVGPTGAAVAAAMTVLGLLPGVRRPALAAVLPAAAHPLVLLDVGAGTTTTDADLVRHARLGAAYAATALGLAAPRVGLLSIGTEPGKGDALRRRAAAGLKHSGLRYVGLVEGHHVPLGGPADVVVTDGFTGNVVLKAVEGALAGQGALAGAPPRGGAGARRAGILLGVRGVVVVGHGAAGPDDVADCVASAAEAVRDAAGTASEVGPAARAAATAAEAAGVGVPVPTTTITDTTARVRVAGAREGQR